MERYFKTSKALVATISRELEGMGELSRKSGILYGKDENWVVSDAHAYAKTNML